MTENLSTSKRDAKNENEFSGNSLNPNQVKRVHIKCQGRQSSSEF